MGVNRATNKPEQEVQVANPTDTQQPIDPQPQWTAEEPVGQATTPPPPASEDILDIPEWGGNKSNEGLSIASIMRGYGGVLSTDVVSETTKLVAKTFDEILKAATSADVKALKVISVPSSRTGNFDAVVVLQTTRINGKVITGFHTCLIEASNKSLLPSTITIQGQTVENIVTVNDAYNAGYVGIIQQEVIAGSIAPTIEQKAIPCGYQSIYTETPLEPTRLRDILNEAANSIKATFAMMVKGRQTFRIDALVANPNMRSISTVSLQPEANDRANGLPVRSDIVTELNLVEGKQDNQNQVESRMHMRLSRVASYIDLIYATPNNQNMYNGVPAHYVPRMVITDVSTPIAVDPLNAVLLSLANATSINKNRAYAIQWRDAYNKNDGSASIRDIGAIGYQVPAITDTKKPGLIALDSDIALRNLVEQQLRPEMMYSIDIAQGGASSWLLQIFARAGDGNQNANRLIYNAANVLTSGRFEPIFAKKLNLSVEDARSYRLLSSSGVFHAGYYQRENTRHDLRELDLLAVLNITKGDPLSIETYLGTLSNSQVHPRLLLDRRLRFFRKLVSTVYVKDYVTRYDFLGVFIDSLIEAVNNSKLVINPGNAILTNSQPGYSVSMDDLSNRLSTGTIGNGQTSNFHDPSGNSWGIGNWNTGYQNQQNRTNSW